jgi:hypothetical protein
VYFGGEIRTKLNWIFRVSKFKKHNFHNGKKFGENIDNNFIQG